MIRQVRMTGLAIGTSITLVARSLAAQPAAQPAAHGPRRSDAQLLKALDFGVRWQGSGR